MAPIVAGTLARSSDCSDCALPFAEPGTLAVAPTEPMVGSVGRDYANAIPIIPGVFPAYEVVPAPADENEEITNNEPSPKQARPA